MCLSNYICNNLSKGISSAVIEYAKTIGEKFTYGINASYNLSPNEQSIEITGMKLNILCRWLETLGIGYKQKGDFCVILDPKQGIQLITLLRIQGKVMLINQQ